MNTTDTPSNCIPIRGTDRYVLTESGFVYNLHTGRRLKRHWSPNGHFTLIPVGNGRTYRLMHRKPHIKLPEQYNIPPDLRMIPEYPNYGITPYGAVWRIQGKRNVTPHMVREETRGNVQFVQLLHISGKRHSKSVPQLVQQIWKTTTADDDDDY